MKKWLVLVCLIALSSMTACGSEVALDGQAFSEAEEVETAGETEADYCDLFGWYGDGNCDEFCIRPDPDCNEGAAGGSGSVGSGTTPGSSRGEFEELPSAAPVACPDSDRADVSYFSRNPLECEEDYISQVCRPGTQNFTDEDCGCGCIGETYCPDPDDPDVHYVEDSFAGPYVCQRVDFACQSDQTMFVDECGCGCIDDEGSRLCYDPNDPRVFYASDDPDVCATMNHDNCHNPNTVPFTDECGCGCVEVSLVDD